MLCRFGHLLSEPTKCPSFRKSKILRRTESDESEEDVGVLGDLQGPPPAHEGTVEFKRGDHGASAASQEAFHETYVGRKEGTERKEDSWEAASPSSDIRSLAQQLAPM